jgi:thiol-activated cytolysin
MKKLNLLTLVMTIFMASGIFAQTAPIKQIQKPEDPAIRKIKTSNPATTPVYKKPTTSEINAMVLKRNVYFKSLKVGSPKTKNGQVELKVVNTTFPDVSSTKIIDKSKIDKSDEYCFPQNLDINVKARNFKEFPIDGIPGWLKPGIVMKGVDFLNSTGKIEERYERSPITLATNLRGGSTILEVKNPGKKSNITEAENILISQNANPPFANMIFKYYEVNSLEEIEFKLNGKYSGGFGAFSGSVGLHYGNKKEYNYFMIEFSQNMFQIEVDAIDANNLFIDPNVPTEDYIYLSNVVYGRRGAVVFKSTKTAKELGISAAANVNTGIHKANFNSVYKNFSQDSEVEIELFFYGGSAASAISAMKATIRNKSPLDIFNYLEFASFDHKLAAPIGYELKNLNNEIVGLESNFNQDYETCFPKRDYKLKVTLVDLQCINGRDGGGDNPDDYAIQQYIVYNANGTTKIRDEKRSDINTIPSRKDGPVQVPGMKNVLISGDADHQLHVKQGNKSANRGNTINNSLVFNISHDEFTDPNAQFKIYTWLKEYTNGNDKVLANNIATPVKIKEVLEILSGTRTLNEMEKGTVFEDGQIATGTKFHSFGTGYLMLANIQKLQKMVLEGPIKLGSQGQKAAAWISFELVD